MLIKFDKIMIKKFIWIMNALQVLEALASGKRLVGELYIDEVTRQKESAARVKVFESLPKHIGTASIIAALEREMKIAKEALIDRELINRV